jgi:hypothetical protein
MSHDEILYTDYHSLQARGQYPGGRKELALIIEDDAPLLGLLSIHNCHNIHDLGVHTTLDSSEDALIPAYS